jgi:hypothetical protein
MSASTACSTCRQLVAVDALGIAPHTRYGVQCPGGRPAPKPVQAHEVATRARLTPELRADVAERQREARRACDRRRRALAREEQIRVESASMVAANPNAVGGKRWGTAVMVARLDARRARLAPMIARLPATSVDIAALMGVTRQTAVHMLRSVGAISVGMQRVGKAGRPAIVWMMPEAAAEAAK